MKEKGNGKKSKTLSRLIIGAAQFYFYKKEKAHLNIHLNELISHYLSNFAKSLLAPYHAIIPTRAVMMTETNINVNSIT